MDSVIERNYTAPAMVHGAAMPLTSEQIKAGRALLRWDQTHLAEASGLAEVTIRSIEQRPGAVMIRTKTLYALEAAFAKAGIEFFDEDGDGAGVRFKSRRR